MADITTFIRGLAGKAKAPRDIAPDALDKFGPKGDLQAMLAARQGADKDDTARIAYEKMRTLYGPTIDAALRQGRETPGALASKITEAESSTAWDDWKAAAKFMAEAFDMAKALSAARKKAYATARASAMDSIGNAIGMVEIGGGAVASRLAAADAHAAAARWGAAHDGLDAALADAKRVDERAPFVRACRRHAPTIKAAFAIQHEGLGAAFEAAWNKALKTAESGAYQGAALEVEELGKQVDKAKGSKALKKKRDDVVQAREQNVAAMDAAVQAGQVDVKALRKLVIKEIGSKDEPLSLAAQANAVGEDPGAPTREPIGDEDSAETLFKQHDWFALKDMLHKNEISKGQMWDCWRFRRQYVTRLIDKLRKDFPSLIAKTSGSNDLESDIDITFASATPGDDVKAASAFNKAVMKDFKKPPGRVFDVNIYPRDYNAIEESINPDYNVDPIADRDIDQPTGAMQQLSRVDQDVATLLKQRRFLDDKTFADLMNSVIDSAPGAATKKQIRKQFEEGEDIFLTTAVEKVKRIKAKLVSGSKALPPLPLMNQFEALRKKGGLEALTAAQKLLPQVLEELEAALPAEVMEATDEVYLEKMGALRENQSKIQRLDDPGAAPGDHHDGPCDEAHKGQDHDAWREAEAQRLKAVVKKAQFENIVFANEAYMSQGAIEHVVAGLQAKDAEKKAQALARLTPATLMQSCNEQLADFFKDMKAAEAEIAAQQDAAQKRRETGEAFVHASKYLVRLLDAAQLLCDKFDKFDPPVKLQFALLKAAKAGSPKALKDQVEAVLLALRKSSTVPAAAKGEVGFDEAKTLFGVADIGGFRTLITNFGAELNQQVRNNPEFKEEVAVDEQTQREYFGVPPLAAELKALLDDAKATVEAGFGEGVILAALGEADGEIELAQELLAQVGTARPVLAHLASQLQDAALRAEAALGAFSRIDPKGVLSRGSSLAKQIPAKIKALDEFDTEDLHVAHVVDIERAVDELRKKEVELNQLVAQLSGELKDIIPALSREMVALKKAAG